jgi:hypothetical protein
VGVGFWRACVDTLLLSSGWRAFLAGRDSYVYLSRNEQSRCNIKIQCARCFSGIRFYSSSIMMLSKGSFLLFKERPVVYKPSNAERGQLPRSWSIRNCVLSHSGPVHNRPVVFCAWSLRLSLLAHLHRCGLATRHCARESVAMEPLATPIAASLLSTHSQNGFKAHVMHGDGRRRSILINAVSRPQGLLAPTTLLHASNQTTRGLRVRQAMTTWLRLHLY